MSTGIARDEWLKALNEAGLVHENDTEAVTVAEFAEMFGVDRQTADRQLQRLAQAGKATKTRKAGHAPDGRRLSFVAYRLK